MWSDVVISHTGLCVRSLRTSVRPQKVFFDFNEIWCVGRCRRAMHDGMQYDPTQGQGDDPDENWKSGRF